MVVIDVVILRGRGRRGGSGKALNLGKFYESGNGKSKFRRADRPTTGLGSGGDVDSNLPGRSSEKDNSSIKERSKFNEEDDPRETPSTRLRRTEGSNVVPEGGSG